jgi:uncharacterized integral membrane protein
MQFIKLLLFLLFVAAGSAIAWLNAGHTHINYYFGEIDLPLSVALIGSVVLGILLGVVLTTLALLRAKRENAVLRRKVKTATEELKNLRTIPIKE